MDLLPVPLHVTFENRGRNGDVVRHVEAVPIERQRERHEVQVGEISVRSNLKERPEQWHVDVQPNESQPTRMTNSNMLVQPYLFFNGRCEEALEFYRSAVGAEVEMLSRFKDAPEPGMTQPGMENKVMHASFRIGETILMASDGRCEGEPRFEGFSLSIVVPDEEKAASVFNALAEGGKVTMPLEKTFWAPKFGMLEDRFGVGWMVSVQHKT
jgi:PhnB protein